MPTYQLLNQHHQCYDLETLERRELLYQGGRKICRPEYASRFMPQSIGETDTTYKIRLMEATYTNIFGAIVDQDVAALFAPDLTVVTQDQSEQPAYYDQFAKNCDQQGTSLQSFLRHAFKTAIIHDKAYIGVDLPKATVKANSKAEQELLGHNACYLYHIDNEAVIDYQKVGRKFQWVKLRKVFPKPCGPLDKKGQIVTQFKIWTMENGKAKAEVWEYITDKNVTIGDHDEARLVPELSGVTTFTQIPIFELCVPDGLSLGNKISELCADYFRLKSALLFGEKRSLFSQAVFQQGAELPAAPPGGPPAISQVGLNPHRGQEAYKAFQNRGWMVHGPNDKMYFAAPPTDCFELSNQQLKEMMDDIYRTANQLSQSVSANTHGMSRSGTAKQQDNQALEQLLEDYGKIVRDFADMLYTFISDVRGEDIEWLAAGLSDYKIVDRDVLLNEAMSRSAIAIHSKAFQKNYEFHIAQQLLPKVDPSLENEIKKELEEYYKNLPADAFDMTRPKPQAEDDEEENE